MWGIDMGCSRDSGEEERRHDAGGRVGRWAPAVGYRHVGVPCASGCARFPICRQLRGKICDRDEHPLNVQGNTSCNEYSSPQVHPSCIEARPVGLPTCGHKTAELRNPRIASPSTSGK